MKYFISCFLFIFTLNVFSADIEVSGTPVKQGDFFTVLLPETDYDITFKGNKTDIKIYNNRETAVAIIPVHYSTSVGTYPLKVTRGGKEVFTRDIKVTDGGFEKSYITVDKTMKKKRSDSNMKAMINHTREARKTSSDTKLWKKEFHYPVPERITSPYGAMRFINNKVSGYHSGVDFGVPIGTPVKATNSGRVILSMTLTSTGNTIIIDHGYNLFSSYAHLDSLGVDVGDIVESGQLIGRSGNTGFTTGPHLHFTMSIGNTFINPMLLMEKELLE